MTCDYFFKFFVTVEHLARNCGGVPFLGFPGIILRIYFKLLKVSEACLQAQVHYCNTYYDLRKE
jgi:hypothetical protein